MAGSVALPEVSNFMTTSSSSSLLRRDWRVFRLYKVDVKEQTKSNECLHCEYGRHIASADRKVEDHVIEGARIDHDQHQRHRVAYPK